MGAAGFVVVKLHGDEKMGEIEMVGVDPDFQGRGIGAARRAYEKAGFGLWPVARYFKKL